MLSGNPKQDIFRSSYKKFAQQLLLLVAQRFQESGARQLFRQKFRFYGHNWTIEPNYIDGYEECIPWHDDQFFLTVEAEDCMKAFVSAGLANCIRFSENSGTPKENRSFERLFPYIAVELTHPIRYLIRKHRSIRLSSRHIERCLDKYVPLWLEQKAPDPRYAPIYNFHPHLQSIRLSQYVSIVPFTDDKKTEIFDAIGPLGRGFDIQSYAECTHVAVQRQFDSRYDPNKKKEIEESAGKALRAAITCLRLVKTEMVGTTGFIRVQKVPRTGGAGLSPLESYDMPMHSIFRGRYELDYRAARRFRGIYRMLSDTDFDVMDGLELPLRQFNRSCQRERDADKILDYAICLESTLLHGVEDELSYRLSLRAAKLLRLKCKPAETFNIMRCMYDIRSAIVHSNESFGGPKTRKTLKKLGVGSSEYMQSLDSVMRLALNEIIRQMHRGNTLSELCKQLDVAVVNGL